MNVVVVESATLGAVGYEAERGILSEPVLRVRR
jgi:hypothetical protein